MLHWDGQRWSIALSDISETLLGVWQRSKDDVWMVGIAWDISGGLIRHWDGADWSWTALNGVSTLWDVWDSPDNTLWIGGTSQAGSGFLAQAHDRELARAGYGGGSLGASGAALATMFG